MSNASRCLIRAAIYETRAARSGDEEEHRVWRALAGIWSDMAPLAGDFDRERDSRTKERIFALVDAAGRERRKVA